MRVYLAGRRIEGGAPEFQTNTSSFTQVQGPKVMSLIEHGMRLTHFEGQGCEMVQVAGTSCTAYRLHDAIIIADKRFPVWAARALAASINHGDDLVEVLRCGHDPEDALLLWCMDALLSKAALLCAKQSRSRRR